MTMNTTTIPNAARVTELLTTYVRLLKEGHAATDRGEQPDEAGRRSFVAVIDELGTLHGYGASMGPLVIDALVESDEVRAYIERYEVPPAALVTRVLLTDAAA
jgi:hypothetical protein